MNIDRYNRIVKLKSIFIVFFYSSSFVELEQQINKLRTQCIKTYHNDVFLYIKCDEKSNQSVVESLFIKSVPMFFIYKNGILIEEIFGNYENILKIISVHI